MADKKRTRSRNRRSRGNPQFHEVKGKIVEKVELDPAGEFAAIVFQDQTALTFNIDPLVAIYPELSDWKTGDWKGIKRWPAVQSRGSMVRWL
jgi:hypothetical protein